MKKVTQKKRQEDERKHLFSIAIIEAIFKKQVDEISKLENRIKELELMLKESKNL